MPVVDNHKNRAGWWLVATTMILLYACVTAANAVPGTPADDNEVLETLPTSFLDQKNDLSVLQKKLNEQPENLSLATALAKKYIDKGRTQSDPRQFGYAQAVLKPWWKLSEPPDEILLLRATMLQHHHQYDKAVTDLKKLLTRQPRHAQAWLTLSVIQQVRGDYAGAGASCAALARVSSGWISSLCFSQVLAMTGNPERAYQIQSKLARQLQRNDPELLQWLLTLMGETVRMSGENNKAEDHFKEALRINHRDPYLMRVYSDLLIQQQRPDDVLKLLADEIHDDALLLQLAIAAKQADKEKKLQKYKGQLETRYRAAHLRGSNVHQREEVLFYLQVINKPDKALELALSNWAVQKELEDTRIVLKAALVSGQTQAAKPVLEWIRNNKTQDIRLKKLVKELSIKNVSVN